MVKKLIIGSGMTLGLIIASVLWIFFINAPVKNQELDVVRLTSKSGASKVLYGAVEPKSVYHEPSGRLIFKVLQNNGQVLKVVYVGLTPKGFQGRVQVAMEGQDSVEGVFIAKRIWVYTSNSQIDTK